MNNEQTSKRHILIGFDIKDQSGSQTITYNRIALTVPDSIKTENVSIFLQELFQELINSKADYEQSKLVTASINNNISNSEEDKTQ